MPLIAPGVATMPVSSLVRFVHLLLKNYHVAYVRRLHKPAGQHKSFCQFERSRKRVDSKDPASLRIQGGYNNYNSQVRPAVCVRVCVVWCLQSGEACVRAGQGAQPLVRGARPPLQARQVQDRGCGEDEGVQPLGQGGRQAHRPQGGQTLTFGRTVCMYHRFGLQGSPW